MLNEQRRREGDMSMQAHGAGSNQGREICVETGIRKKRGRALLDRRTAGLVDNWLRHGRLAAIVVDAVDELREPRASRSRGCRYVRCGPSVILGRRCGHAGVTKGSYPGSNRFSWR